MKNTIQIMLFKIEIDNLIAIRDYYKKQKCFFMYESQVNAIIYGINKIIIKLGGKPYYGRENKEK